MKFKIGNRVKFVKEFRSHTDEVKIGEVYKIIRTDETDMPYEVENGEWFTEEELELVEYTYEDLKKSPIGTRVTFENSKVLIKIKNNYYEESKYEECEYEGFYRNDQDLENLEDNRGSCLLGKIIKIEEPEYKTVYEYKPEILDEAEKRYLRGVIRPFRNKIRNIGRYKSLIYTGKNYISIVMKDDFSIELPYFKKDVMYKGMEDNKEYTLEELGL